MSTLELGFTKYITPSLFHALFALCSYENIVHADPQTSNPSIPPVMNGCFNVDLDSVKNPEELPLKARVDVFITFTVDGQTKTGSILRNMIVLSQARDVSEKKVQSVCLAVTRADMNKLEAARQRGKLSARIAGNENGSAEIPHGAFVAVTSSHTKAEVARLKLGDYPNIFVRRSDSSCDRVLTGTAMILSLGVEDKRPSERGTISWRMSADNTRRLMKAKGEGELRVCLKDERMNAECQCERDTHAPSVSSDGHEPVVTISGKKYRLSPDGKLVEKEGNQ